MKKIVILDGYTVNPGDLSWNEITRLADTEIFDRTASHQIVERCRDAEIVLTNKVPFTADIINSLPNLKYIGVMATGYNIIDLNAARQRGITVTNVPAYSTESVAQMTIAHILNVANRVDHYARENRNLRWSKSPDFCYYDTTTISLSSSTLGIIGLGNIGMRVAEIANVFGMKIIAFTNKNKTQLPTFIAPVGLETIFSDSDIVSLHCPLTEETKHIVSAKTINLMKPTAIVVNTSRGQLVCEDDIAKALKNNQLAAYCADVLQDEPPSVQCPLTQLHNAFITPHIAWASIQSRTTLIKTLANNISAFLRQSPINKI